ncbi:MAG: hypothetical protein EOP39_02285 [Rubrivivax sp.]|nr:MAG: hypothetical protein EOP39_02285 [Rubrivivax sp.]
MKRRQWTLAFAGTLLSRALPAMARDDDDGEFVIQRAIYGTRNKNVDVTGRLRELAGRDRRFRLANEVFGLDPDPGRTKTLRIIARDRRGQERTFEYRERDWVDGGQFAGWRSGKWGNGHSQQGSQVDARHGGRDDGEYTILYATYGVNYREVDVTDRLRELARGDQRLRMGNDTFGVDPAPGQTKRLRITARDRNGQERQFEYREDAVVDGAQFVGWGRGNWGRSRGTATGGLVIERARYGSDNRWADVTEALRAQVRGDRLDVEVRNELFGVDPAPGQHKTLELTYRSGNGQTSTVRVGENDALRLP